MNKMVLFVFLSTALSCSILAQSLTTSFLYQGQLQELGDPVGGNFDFRFKLFDTEQAGAQIGPIIQLDDISLEAGTFTVPLDFGSVFDGQRLWLEIEVRPSLNGGDFTRLEPRQEVTIAPYSYYSVESERSESSAQADSADLLQGFEPADFLSRTGGTLNGGLVVAANLGVGRENPIEKLEVEGNILAQGTVCGANGCIGDAAPDPWTLNADGSVYRLENVAIGRFKPEEKLHVQGSIAYSKKLRHGSSTADGEDSVALGPSNHATGTFSVAIGSGNVASGARSVALGTGTVASGGFSTAMGSSTTASRDGATSMGPLCQCT